MTAHVLTDPHAAVQWLRERGARGLVADSRAMKAGDAFIAWPGYASDGRGYVAPSLAAGAVACLVEAEGVEAFDLPRDERIAAYRGLKAATGAIADLFFHSPTRSLEVLAVTGTNGKTSSTWWIAQACSLLGRPGAVVGTLGVGQPPQVQSTGLTTPDPIRLQAAFRGFVESGVEVAAIEASSIGIVEHRLAGTRIAVALFTNFTRDHLDYHGSMQAYQQAKAELFAWPALRAAVLNVDDPVGALFAADALARGVDVWTYAVASQGRHARLMAHRVGYEHGGLAFDVIEGEQTVRVRTSLIGDYNVSNLLGVIGGLRALGIALTDIATVCAHLGAVPGRMQRVEPAGAGLPVAVVDYAHTPDALEKAIAALRALADARGGALHCVFGCGGNRDASKRPLMGAIAEHGADHVIVTSDNPRNEEPQRILEDIAQGMRQRERAQFIEDRRAAIAQALREAAPADVVLIAGKGHEDYQEVAGVKHPLSDMEEARRALAQRGAGEGGPSC